ncbi:hypothetical protein HPB52_016994 [Rhipicephalus sanguineus]|uniref:Protein kinase domain-containing protein n=1 Tax=Rhipicephalus sanguineus TaxID=34632 RepID=A0A9D4ST18_RHISA|nr:hypothetical protein HPB52_016994 [Rhipicephalus sanguineus]
MLRRARHLRPFMYAPTLWGYPRHSNQAAFCTALPSNVTSPFLTLLTPLLERGHCLTALHYTRPHFFSDTGIQQPSRSLSTTPFLILILTFSVDGVVINPHNVQLSSRIDALRAEIVAYSASVEHSRWNALCDGLDSALHSRSTWEIEAALATHSNRSAPGREEITYTTLRNLPDNAKEFRLETFNEAWDSGCLPSSWTSSLISMMPKPGKPPSLSNFRPISLTWYVGKTFERMALTRLSDFIVAREFFPHSLIGFRRRVCAQDQAYVTVMEYLAGVDLMRILNHEHYLEIDVVQIIMAQLVLALQHMHYKGFLHRDIKVSKKGRDA